MIQRLTISLYPGDMVNMIMIQTRFQEGLYGTPWKALGIQVEPHEHPVKNPAEAVRFLMDFGENLWRRLAIWKMEIFVNIPL